MSFPHTFLTDTFAVAPQLQVADIAEVAQAGFRSLIINRPDMEGGPEQPRSDDVMAAARQAGMQVAYHPVVSGAMTADDVVVMRQLLSQLPAPVLAYCRSGTRSARLFEALG